MKSKSFLLLLISLGIWIITIGLAMIRSYLDFDVIVLGIVGSLSLGTSFAGIILGFFDKHGIFKYIGITFNLFLLTAFAFIFVFSDTNKNQTNLTFQQFRDTLPDYLDETEINVGYHLITDAVSTWDSLKIQYWLKGDQAFREAATNLGVNYEKVFLHYPDGFGDQVEEFSVSSDSVILRVPISNQRNSSSMYQREVSIGIRAAFKSENFQYDTTYLVAVKYMVRAPSSRI